MATGHDTLLNDAGWPALAELHGESVSVTVAGGTATAVTAVVERMPLAARPTSDRFPAWRVELTVRASDWPAAAVAVGSDRVTLALHPPATATTTLRVLELLEQGGGLWRLGCG
jgi:hypothetical protein